jgi:soluble lytic murein transglycosylase-like protein
VAASQFCHNSTLNRLPSLTAAVKKQKDVCKRASEAFDLTEHKGVVCMKLKLMSGFAAAFIATAMMGAPAQAAKELGCAEYGTCGPKQRVTSKKIRTAKVVKTRKLSGKRVRSDAALGGIPAGRGHVVAMIKARAASYGVPAWFALRIARVESGYNPRARGGAGEYGVFQLKCATARGIGFRGNCGQLLNASTNVNYGLKHLSLAVRSSRGNLKLAASKHNGGLGRKSLVPKYVRLVF